MSCGTLLEFEECRVDGDCAGRDAALICSSEGYCVLPLGEEQVGNCTNTACVAQNGENYVCGAQNRCVSALTPECTEVFGPIDRDNTVILGSILPTVGDFAGLGQPMEWAIQMAAEEINDAGGLPGGRNIAVIGCDSSGSRDQGLAAARHLVDELGVAGIIGPAFSSIYIDAATEVTIPGGTLTMSPSATSYLISGLDDQDLAWRTVASDDFQGAAIADLVRERGWNRVIALGKGDAYGRGLLFSVSEALASELGEEGFVSFEYADPGGDSPPDLGALVRDALDGQPAPDAILLLGTSELVELVNTFELSLDGQAQPFYVLADGGKDADLLLPYLQERDELRTRILGTEPDHQNGDIHEAFALRFRQKFRQLPGIYTPNSYDALYLMAYAIMASPDQGEPTGATIAAALPTLVKGRPVVVGPDSIADARNTLTGGGTIDFDGASGPLNFNLSTGEAPADVSQWGVQRRDNGELRFETVRSYQLQADGEGKWEPLP